MTAEPPSLAGGCQVRVTVWLPGVAVAPVGAPGTVGVVAVATALVAPHPAALCAMTRYWFVTPFASPVFV